MPDFVIPLAMVGLGLLTAGAVYKAWWTSKSRPSSPPADDVSAPTDVLPASTTLVSTDREISRPSLRQQSPASVASSQRTLSTAWSRAAPWIAVAMVAMVAAGSAMAVWLRSSAEAPSRERSRLVVIAWGVALTAGVFLAMASRRRSDLQKTSD